MQKKEGLFSFFLLLLQYNKHNKALQKKHKINESTSNQIQYKLA